jgi:hypothetical protein
LILEHRFVGVMGLFGRHRLEDESLEQLLTVARTIARNTGG